MPYRVVLLISCLLLSAVSMPAQTSKPAGGSEGQVAADSWVFDTYTPGPCSPTGARHGGCSPGELVRIELTTVASGLAQPWHMTFVPGTNDFFVTELPGRLRLVRNGVLDPSPVPGWPSPSIRSRTLNSVVLHPRFTENRFVYLTYVKGRGEARTPTTVALARARFDGRALTAVEEIFEADAWGGGSAPARAEFGPDGMLYFAIGVRDSMNGSDDHRNLQGLAWHPETGEMWGTEIGPMGGDELNRLIPGGNYGWPLVSLGRIYNSSLASDQPWWRPGIEMPVMFWSPAISPSSIMIYSGDRFPPWKGHFFIGALSGQQLQRVAFNQPGPQTERRESMLVSLDARVRDVRQAPDGSIYIAVERDTQLGPGSTRQSLTGSVLRIDPAR